MITITDDNVPVRTLATSGQSATAKGFDPKHRMKSSHQQGDCNRVHFLWDINGKMTMVVFRTHLINEDRTSDI